MKPLVTFDLWETLIMDPPGKMPERKTRRLDLIEQALREYGHPVVRTRLEATYVEHWKQVQEVWAQGGEVNVPEQIRGWLELAGCRLPLGPEELSHLERLYVQPFLEDMAPAIPSARETVAAARAAGCTVGLISNTGRTPGSALRKCLDAHGLLEFFDFTLFSDEELIRKPHPEIFHRAAGRAGVETGLHIGDHLEYDITGAHAAGWEAVWVNPDAAGRFDSAAEFVWPNIAAGAAWFNSRSASARIFKGGE